MAKPIATALKNCMANPEYHIEHALVLCHENVCQKEKITYLPIYMTMFLHKETTQKPIIYQVDLSGLR